VSNTISVQASGQRTRLRSYKNGTNREEQWIGSKASLPCLSHWPPAYLKGWNC